jgi:hypothetical protein
MKYLLSITSLVLILSAQAQSKKAQIIKLNHNIDSLQNLIDSSNSKWDSVLIAIKDSTQFLSAELTSLHNEISILTEKTQKDSMQYIKSVSILNNKLSVKKKIDSKINCNDIEATDFSLLDKNSWVKLDANFGDGCGTHPGFWTYSMKNELFTGTIKVCIDNSIERIVEFKNGKPTPNQKSYYSHGQLARESAYDSNMNLIRYKSYNLQGKVISEGSMEYSDLSFCKLVLGL